MASPSPTSPGGHDNEAPQLPLHSPISPLSPSKSLSENASAGYFQQAPPVQEATQATSRYVSRFHEDSTPVPIFTSTADEAELATDGNATASEPELNVDPFTALRDDQGVYPVFVPTATPHLTAPTYKEQHSAHGNFSFTPRSVGSPQQPNYRPPLCPPKDRTDVLPTANEIWPAWTPRRFAPLTAEEISDIFVSLTNALGFQRENMRNTFDLFMSLLDSRASRMTPTQALITLHADYIGGQSANYRKWYFAAQLDLDDEIGDRQALFGRKFSRVSVTAGRHKNPPPMPEAVPKDLETAERKWRERMHAMPPAAMVRQISLWLLIWGEASNVRHCPELLCFLFKLADDYYTGPECAMTMAAANAGRGAMLEGAFLDEIISPLYAFIRGQSYEKIGDTWIRKEKDHAQIVGYDDVNQLFWYSETIDRLALKESNGGTKLSLVPRTQRYFHLKNVDWEAAFTKTYKEKRTWLHVTVNFTRIWIIHVCAFWFYNTANAPFLYLNPNPKIAAQETPVQWSIVGLGGAIATVFMLINAMAEYAYVPLTWKTVGVLTRKVLLLCLVFLINFGPMIYVVVFNRTSNTAMIVSLVQFCIGVITTLCFAILPSSRLFSIRSKRSRKTLASSTFTASFAPLRFKDQLLSIALWVCVFASKFAESYFFLTRSFIDSLKVMSGMRVLNCGDSVMGGTLCRYMPVITLVLMCFMDLVLFFLDTYLWYILWNAIFSICEAFHFGFNVLTPFRAIFARVPKRLYENILVTNGAQVQKYKPKVLCAQLWNGLVITMYREHLLSINHVQRLLYQQVEEDNKRILKPPTFFDPNRKVSQKDEYYPEFSEAERRIGFFSQSLATPMPAPLPVENTPTFTVLTPHYSEKVLLSLREILREDENSRVTLLEYLKQLHPVEWDNFVRDTRMLAEESGVGLPSSFDYTMTTATDSAEEISEKMTSSSGSKATGSGSNNKARKEANLDDFAYYSVGFKTASPEFTVRTRIWASLRAQTLYRTVSGFMNYQKALKLLYRVENPDLVQMYSEDPFLLDREIEKITRRKFRYLIAMQRFAKFNREERENADFLLRAYPDLQIAYIEEEPPLVEGGDPVFFSTLIDGYSEVFPDGTRKPKYRVRLPGNPILGDGKADNQNHALIYYRGEYLQLVDANQDNYLEECIKIRNMLGEFEEYVAPPASPYNPNYNTDVPNPVAIVGAREYIFSENIGVLGDVAAGKEQTFGTLSQRNMAKIGGKLHYGHPDFLNATFMTTRGGVSKAQKGLHLNEDIYAGMNAFQRGGRIKHTEYYQCGKGRDLGFASILNFTTKIGTGMGEQMLSREYYYLGTQLPLDRFLTFYYAHPGFQINNIFIMLAVQLFMIVLMFIGSMNSVLLVCSYNPKAPPGTELGPPGCYNLVPIYDWITRCIISIFLVVFIAFLPLFLQELTEKGFIRSITRLGKQFLSLSPLFEVFVTQIYTNSILSDLTFGGARYIATGRGFATARIPFSMLYSRFAGPSIYFGFRTMFMLLFVTLTYWSPYLIYFWITGIALIVCPFLFNPSQFNLIDFIVDYREFLRWLSRGNVRSHANSWAAYCRLTRTRLTGYRRPKLGDRGEKLSVDVPRPHLSVVFFSELFIPLVIAFITFLSYSFVLSFNPSNHTLSNTGNSSSIMYVLIFALGPIAANAAMLLVLGSLAILMGPMMGNCFPSFGSWTAGIAHTWAVLTLVASIEVFWYTQRWNFSETLLGLLCIAAVQRFIFKFLWTVFLTREIRQDDANKAWWSGTWHDRGFGFAEFMTQPFREFIVKIVEMTMFATDFLLGHVLLFLLFPLCIIPGLDRLHMVMLFWLRPSKQIREPVLSPKRKQKRRFVFITYGLLFILVYLAFAAMITVPLVLKTQTTWTAPSIP